MARLDLDKGTYTYNPALVQIRLGNVFLTGFGEDDIITIETNEDDIIPKTDVWGNVHYTENNSETATMKVSIMSSSPQINYIRALARNNEEFPVDLTDRNDAGSLMSCDGCRIIKQPDYIRGKEADTVEFEVFIPFYRPQEG